MMCFNKMSSHLHHISPKPGCLPRLRILFLWMAVSVQPPRFFARPHVSGDAGQVLAYQAVSMVMAPPTFERQSVTGLLINACL